MDSDSDFNSEEMDCNSFNSDEMDCKSFNSEECSSEQFNLDEDFVDTKKGLFESLTTADILDMMNECIHEVQSIVEVSQYFNIYEQ